jgi:hypothetical protein
VAGKASEGKLNVQVSTSVLPKDPTLVVDDSLGDEWRGRVSESRHLVLNIKLSPIADLFLTLITAMTTTPKRLRELKARTDDGTIFNGEGQRRLSRYGLDAGAVGRTMMPVLAHKLKHNKSILALAVSEDTLFAGTEGGEILVGTFATSEVIAEYL